MGKDANRNGEVFISLGLREDSHSYFENAVLAFRSALEGRNREQMPLDWATSQGGLALALTSLGQRRSDVGRLEEAVDAHRAYSKYGRMITRRANG